MPASGTVVREREPGCSVLFLVREVLGTVGV